MTAACTLTNGEIEDWTKRREHLFMNELHLDFFHCHRFHYLLIQNSKCLTKQATLPLFFGFCFVFCHHSAQNRWGRGGAGTQ